MNSKNTLTWFVIAAALFGFIFVYQFFERPAVAAAAHVLPDLRPLAVTSVQVIPNGAFEISAERKEDNWFLTKPVAYPAQRAAIEALLEALQNLKPAIRISAADMRANHGANSGYGFEPPRTALTIQAGQRSWQISVGNKTAPGDQVFVRVVGVEGAFVTDAGWLKYIPHSANDWRDTALVNAGENSFDSIVLTNGTKIIELDRDPTNHLWQMTRPLNARANNDFINNALQQLQTARVSQFVTDNPKPDLTGFGLQPADLDLWLDQGSNFVAAVHIGKNSTNNPSQVFAKREGWNAIMATAKQPLSPWYGAVNTFRDPYLFELTAPVAEIEVRGPGTNHFTLQRSATNGWQIAGEKFPVDADSVHSFIKTLAGLRVAEFVKDVVTPADLPAYGLTNSLRQITLRSAIGDTNAVIAQLLFGSATTNEVFVRRADEDFIYAITTDDFNTLFGDDSLFASAHEFREHRIWNFNENDVTQITIHQNGKTRQMIHNGPDKWSLAPGSQGIINPPAIEEVAHDLGDLTAVAWLSRGISDPAQFGFKPENLSITLTLKTGEALTVDFGAMVSTQTALAAVTLDGERWAFIFPPASYQLVLSYLTIPANVP
jgi:Domain of unknown function (DUF4340)